MNMAMEILFLYKDMLLERPHSVSISDDEWRKPICPIITLEVAPTAGVITCTDCRSLWDNIQSNRNPKEANLWPDITELKRWFKDKSISRHFWTETGDMAADCMTKKGVDPVALIRVLHGRWNVSPSWKEAQQPIAFADKHDEP
jgi:hypothetical protein